MKNRADIISANAKLRYRVWLDLSTCSGQTSSGISKRLSEPLKNVREAVRTLIQARAIRRQDKRHLLGKEAFYEVTPGVRITPPDGYTIVKHSFKAKQTDAELEAQLEKIREELEGKALEDDEDDEPRAPQVIRNKRPPPLPAHPHLLDECWPWPSMKKKETA